MMKKQRDLKRYLYKSDVITREISVIDSMLSSVHSYELSGRLRSIKDLREKKKRLVTKQYIFNKKVEELKIWLKMKH